MEEYTATVDLKHALRYYTRVRNLGVNCFHARMSIYVRLMTFSLNIRRSMYIHT